MLSFDFMKLLTLMLFLFCGCAPKECMTDDNLVICASTYNRDMAPLFSGFRMATALAKEEGIHMDKVADVFNGLEYSGHSAEASALGVFIFDANAWWAPRWADCAVAIMFHESWHVALIRSGVEHNPPWHVHPTWMKVQDRISGYWSRCSAGVH